MGTSLKVGRILSKGGIALMVLGCGGSTLNQSTQNAAM